MPIEAQSRTKSGRVAPVNAFLLCTVLAKQTRRLGSLLPDRRIAELIAIAMKNCADYELALDLGPGVPEVVRAEAMQIGRLTRRPEPPMPSSFAGTDKSQFAAVVSAPARSAADAGPACEASLLDESATVSHVSVGGAVESPDFRRELSNVQRRELPGVQRKHSMSKSNGVDLNRVRQLRAMAENLCTLANRHRENHNYVVAHALYGHALTVAQEIHAPENDENALVTRIRKDQQAVFEMLRSGESHQQNPPLEKAQEVGR
jgi:hypothetical protein